MFLHICCLQGMLWVRWPLLATAVSAACLATEVVAVPSEKDRKGSTATTFRVHICQHRRLGEHPSPGNAMLRVV